MANNVGLKPIHGYDKKTYRKSMQQFATELQNAANRSLPPNIKPYNGVFVLAMHWSNDKTGVAPLEDELCQIFTSVYGYTVEKYLIDATIRQYDTRKQLRKRMERFSDDYDQPGNLLIVVYSGHAAYINPRGERVLAGEYSDIDINWSLSKPTIDWDEDATAYIRDTYADALLISDTCYASSTAVENTTGPEVIAASTWHTVAGGAPSTLPWHFATGGAPPTSFSKLLITELKRLNGNPASAASIYAEIHRNTKPSAEATACPLHVAKGGRDSIALSKLGASTFENPTIIGPLQPKDERVLIQVRLSDHNGVTTPDIGQWTGWLTSNLPSNISKTQISTEGVFDTNSALILLVSMPLEVWTMLPDGDDAYGFISFVSSGNRLLPRQTTLPLRNMENL
ncbi:uncharacterized protein BP5553_02230 [Venustampulla echinocandica]|uniref:Caspase domain-containing protein n=1 Tax=Venustampulla echinocandica TaxID=2656787 RepID=A0A370U391_9HELO|nr:uncharacterized protein BP5553_02230 [Venustampulla echinocandica]RDL42251.1 hypothetical protein BP5553_02230 [Venustampulla echinocandica]